MKDTSEFKGFDFIGKNDQGFKEYRHKQSDMIFVLIPAGAFIMGVNDGRHFKDTNPIHPVKIGRFLMAKYQVTQGVWLKIMNNNPSEFTKSDKHPVERVSWESCQEFCQKTGLQLPTEAEWEYAYRAGTVTQYYWGDIKNKDYMWYQENSTESTQPVGQKTPNNFGLYDMAGNIWEWCQDWYGEYPYTEQTNPVGPSQGELRVMRGGCWFSFSYNCRAANRFGAKPGKIMNLNGFRCAATV